MGSGGATANGDHRLSEDVDVTSAVASSSSSSSSSSSAAAAAAPTTNGAAQVAGDI